MVAPQVWRPGHPGQLVLAVIAFLVAVAAVWHGTLSPVETRSVTRSEAAGAENSLDAVRSLVIRTPGMGALPRMSRLTPAPEPVAMPAARVTLEALGPASISSPGPAVGPAGISSSSPPAVGTAGISSSPPPAVGTAGISSPPPTVGTASVRAVALPKPHSLPLFNAASATGAVGRESLATAVHSTATPELGPGDRVVATVSFYYCAAGSSPSGDGGSWCGVMRDGKLVYPGAAACDYAYIGQQFRIEGDPSGRVYTCNDTGSAVHGLHRDIWFRTNDEGWRWQREMGRRVVIEIVN